MTSASLVGNVWICGFDPSLSDEKAMSRNAGGSARALEPFALFHAFCSDSMVAGPERQKSQNLLVALFHFGL